MAHHSMATSASCLHSDHAFQVVAVEDCPPGNDINQETSGSFGPECEIQESDGQEKPSQMSQTLQWLDEHYERAEGVCLPRCVLYTHYTDLCKKEEFEAVGAATFGKLLRQKFPRVTTRRLGTRGQSKYHYYGIGIKVTSQYYQSVYNGKGLTRFSGTKVKTEGTARKYSLSAKAGKLLPDFPDATLMQLPEETPRDKVETLMFMYQTHCQRILDAVISANFYEVKNLLLHFWQGMPEHLSPLLMSEVFHDVIPVCDDILYKAILDTVIPSTIQDIPESLATEIKIFAKQLPGWMQGALEGAPEPVVKRKVTVLRPFIKNIRGQLSFIQLAQTTRQVLTTADIIPQMAKDLSRLDISRICLEMGFNEHSTELKNADDAFASLKKLLSTHSTIEDFTEWLDVLLDSCVLRASTDKSFQSKAACFLLLWSAVGSVVMRDLTLCSAPSFGSLHLLHLMLNEYIFLIIESPLTKQRSKILRGAYEKHLKRGAMKASSNLDKGTIIVSPTSRRRKVSRKTATTESQLNTEKQCLEPRVETTAVPSHFNWNPDLPAASTEKNYQDLCAFYHPMSCQYYSPQYPTSQLPRTQNFWQDSYERNASHRDPRNPLQCSYGDYDPHFTRRPSYVQDAWPSPGAFDPTKASFYPGESYPRSGCFTYGTGNSLQGAQHLSSSYVDVTCPQNTMPAPRTYGPTFQEGVYNVMPASHF